MKILDSKCVQEWESRSLNECSNITSLMQEAVDGLEKWIKHRFPPGRALALCGKGNNGNDTLWLADRLKKAGWQVDILLSHARKNRTELDVKSIKQSLDSAQTWPKMGPASYFASCPVLILDGLLGLGAHGTPRPPYADIIQWIHTNKRSCDRLLSIDIPSGVDPDTGECADPHFRADFTVAIGAVKSGCLTERGAAASGRLTAIPISLSPPAPESDREFFSLEDARLSFPGRNADTYKNRQGAVSIWAGSPGMAGAAILASRAALKSGAGLVRLFVPESLVPILMTATPEVMVHPVTTRAGSFHPGLFEADAILAGPGLGNAPELPGLFADFVSSSSVSCPLVLDADALNCCGPGKFELAGLPEPTVLTPHPGEFRRLFPGQSSERVNCSANALQFTSLNPHCTLVLKGPQTIVSQDGQPLSYNGSGNPGLATAGSGDVLAGLTAGLLATGCGAREAARLAVFWHGHAADLAVKECGEASLTAGTVIDFLGSASLDLSRP